MKLLLVVCLCAVATFARQLTEGELKLLAETPFEKLPKELQAAIRRSKIRSQTDEDGLKISGHWCCANEQPINSIQKTRTRMEMVKVHEKVKIGYTNCGWLGSARCTLYDLRYRSEPRYYLDYYEVPDQTACPDNHVQCCEGYVKVANDNCLSLEEAKKHIDTLKELKENGLIGF